MYIVATISKNSYGADKVREIITAGAEVLRYNFSHGSPEEVRQKIAVGKSVIKEMNLTGKVKILADLPGSKIRLGHFPQKEQPAKAGQAFLFKSAASAEDPAEFVPVDFENVGKMVESGQIFTLGDGEIAFEVIEIIDDGSFAAKALNDGIILNMKGINITEGIDRLNHLNEKTIAAIKILPEIKPDWIAFSFISGRDYLNKAKKLLEENGAADWKPLIVSKVESPAGVANIDEIIEDSDIIMIARGDLGLTVPIEDIGLIQKDIIARVRKAGKNVFVATHILGSLLSYYVPARSEVVDLTQIVLDGADGIMLTKETGISPTPGYSVSVAKKIISRVENI